MTEQFFQDPEAIETIFPNPLRRTLVTEFIGEVSQLDCVEKVAAIQPGRQGQHYGIFVFTRDVYGIPGLADFDQVLKARLKVCTDEGLSELLGHVGIVTESLFREDQEIVPGLKDREVLVLWQRPKEAAQA